MKFKLTSLGKNSLKTPPTTNQKKGSIRPPHRFHHQTPPPARWRAVPPWLPHSSASPTPCRDITGWRLMPSGYQFRHTWALQGCQVSAGATVYTLPETNIFAPEDGWLEDDPFLLERPIFRGYIGFKKGKYESQGLLELHRLIKVQTLIFEGYS